MSFVDESFPLDSSSLYIGGSPPDNAGNVEWRRLSEVSKEESCSDLPLPLQPTQGRLADCYLLTALVALARYGPRVESLVMKQDEGKYMVKLFAFDRWHMISVDDHVPVSITQVVKPAEEGESPASSPRIKVLYANSSVSLWPSLVEKVFAKHYGSYEVLRGGNVSESLFDLTGCPVFDVALDTEAGANAVKAGTLWTRMTSPKVALGCNAIDKANPDGPDHSIPQAMPNGILMAHAYAIIDCREVDGKKLVRLRNPQGQNTFASKIWGPGGKGWTQDIRKSFQHPPNDDLDQKTGTLTMSFEEFTKIFNRVYIAYLFDDWPVVTLQGEWKGESAGGCSTFLTWRRNPMFTVTTDQPTRVFITLCQKDCRHNITERGKKLTYLHLGMMVIKLKSKTLHNGLVKDEYEEIVPPSFWNKREVSSDVSLQPGTYIVVPSTYNPGLEGEFSLIVRSELKVDVAPLDWNQEANLHVLQGEWAGKTAGGGPKHKKTFVENPQYALRLCDESITKSVSVRVLVEQHVTKDSNLKDLPSIGVYVVKGTDERFKSKDGLPSSVCIGGPVSFTNAPLIHRKIDIKGGEGPYILIPCTMDPGKTSKFKLTVVTNKDVDVELAEAPAKGDKPLKTQSEDAEGITAETVLDAGKAGKAGAAGPLSAPRNVKGKPGKGKGPAPFAHMGAGTSIDSAHKKMMNVSNAYAGLDL